jgi:hypothetical protein
MPVFLRREGGMPQVPLCHFTGEATCPAMGAVVRDAFIKGCPPCLA